MAVQTYKDFELVTIEITNTDFFFMIDNQVRDIFAAFEEAILLPKVEHIYKENSIDESVLKDYPYEGYYYKTDKLRRYFKLVRNLQHNGKVYESINVDSDAFKLIKSICDRDIFGTLPSDGLSPLPRRKDIMSICMEKMGGGWAIDSIMARLDEFKTGNPNLVELAYLTKNPACLTSGCETNSLYRMFALISGCYMGAPVKPTVYEYVWLVDKEIEELGIKLADEYNKIFDMFPLAQYNQYSGSTLSRRNITSPRPELVRVLNKKPEAPRVAFLGHNLDNGQNYYWILEKDLTVKDLWSKDFITTESYMKTGSGVEYNMAHMLEGQTEKNDTWGGAPASIVSATIKMAQGEMQ
jgi:hypothetical protein